MSGRARASSVEVWPAANVTAHDDRVQRIVTALGVGGAQLSPTGLCRASLDLLAVDGTGIVLMDADGRPCASYSAGVGSGEFEQSQFMLGVGPAFDAYDRGSPMIVADLATDAPDRWFTLEATLIARGVNAVFSFPLSLGTAKVGALTLYRERPSSLEGSELAEAVVTAQILTGVLIGFQVGVPNGQLAPALDEVMSYQQEVHQAAGMLSVKLEVSVSVALARLRACAFANNTSMLDASFQVIDGALQLSK